MRRSIHRVHSYLPVRFETLLTPKLVNMANTKRGNRGKPPAWLYAKVAKYAYLLSPEKTNPAHNPLYKVNCNFSYFFGIFW